jgi:MFS transporter, ACS family, glucarate transporter
MIRPRAIPVRFRILALLVLLSFVNYLLRNNISVAAPSIRAEFGFSSEDLGWIIGSFNLTYALFQLPGGVFGDRFGPRRAMAIIAVAWGGLTFLTGLAPGLMAASAAGAMVALVSVRLLLGVSNAPLYPVMAGAIANWFPVGSWAFPNAMCSMGLALGQAAIGPVVTFLIVRFGWRESFYVLAPIGILAGAWWYWYGRDRPADHPAVTAHEREMIDRGRASAAWQSAAPGSWRTVLLKRDVVLLAASYFCMNYVFYMFAQWLFIYLVEERGFSLLEGGFLYVLPFLTGSVLAVVGGLTCDALCQRIGARWGCRLTGATGLVLVAGFLYAGVFASNAYVAVLLLSLCFGFTQFVDSPYWAATTFAAGKHTSAATGVLNTGGNLPGLLAPAVGLMIDRLGWVPTIASGSLFALVGAGLWLLVRLEGAGGAHQ